ncbi:MAG: hypothetical protein DRP09_20860 [Candidatus Thorarchaeota archaeon]|nr:MAG: hypothetical protein DRP09_20860 [Candidatus Thorarchaeota archaeon]
MPELTEIFPEKITVDVIKPTGIETKKFPVKGNKIIIRPKRRGPGGTEISAKFDRDCLLPYYDRFLFFFKRFKGYKLFWIEGADRCISFRWNADEVEVDAPTCDRRTIEEYFKANVLQAAGTIRQTVQVPTALYLASFMTLGVVILQFLFSIGVLK